MHTPQHLGNKSQLLEAKRQLLTALYLRIVALNHEAFFPGMKLGEYCELLIIVKKIYDLQSRHRSTSLGALARSIQIPRTTLDRRLSRIMATGIVEQHGNMYVLSPEAIDTPLAVRSVERIAAVVEDTAKKLSNLERSTLYH